jgi:hypothetical protein
MLLIASLHPSMRWMKIPLENFVTLGLLPMRHALAQAETRAAFEMLLYDPPSCLEDMYRLMLDNVVHQPAEVAAFAKQTLRVMLQARGPVSISQLAMASDGVKRCFIQTAYWKRSHRGGDI